MTAGTTPSTRTSAVAATRREAPRGVIAAGCAGIALIFTGLMGFTNHWEGGAMFAVIMVAVCLCILGLLIDEDRGARIWVYEQVLAPIAHWRSSLNA